MFDDVEVKLKKGNKLLFNRESESIQPFKQLIQLQTHKALILWALNCALVPAKILNDKYSDERVVNALEKGRLWSMGTIKMPEAKQAILKLHGMAKQLEDDTDIAYVHAVAQAVSTIHVETHALGLVFYELSGLVKKHKNNFDKIIDDKLNYYYNELLYWQEHQDDVEQTWATFIVRDGKINKEKLLAEKHKSK